MPMYEYECEACGKRFERIQKFSDPLVDVCPNCGKKKLHKLVSSPAIQFKGSGFYINDYARKDTAGKDPAGKDTTGTEPSKTPSESAKTDDKPATTASSTATAPTPTSGTKD